jgi:DNA polymerase-3 subunit alpha
VLAWEKELLGLYVSGHPLDEFYETLKDQPTISKIKTGLRNGMTGVVSGIIEDVREINTKKGDKMAFVKIANKTGSLEVVIFPKIYAQYTEIFAVDGCVAIKGKRSDRNSEFSFIADAAKRLGKPRQKTEAVKEAA